MKRVILIIPLMALLVTDSFSQWTVVGNKLFGPHTTPYGGVITFNDGIVWAGLNHLVNSLDSGTTWNSIADPLQGSQLSEICFLNKDTGAIACIDRGIFLTNDGGKTWRHILTVSECFGLSFARNGNEMFVAERAGLVGTVHYTADGGLTWTDQQIEGSGGGAYDAAYNPKTGNAYVLSRYIFPTRASHINISSDFGKTWQRQIGNVDLDCYSFALDSCDPNKIYLGNEEFDESANNLSEIFVSADEGKSWSSKAQGPEGFFSAAFSSAPNAIYTASALGQGIFRSLDRGTSWKSIGGPSPREDTRLLCAINNNIVLAADQQGNVWRTLNSGGDSVSVPNNGKVIKFSISSKLILNDSLGAIISLPIFLKRQGMVPSFDLVVHYPTTSLIYLGSILSWGKNIDIPGERRSGRAKLHFDQDDIAAISDSLIGFAVFKWFPYENDCSHIIFDSIDLGGSYDQCSGQPAIFDTASEGIIGSYPSCGLDLESDVDPPQVEVRKNTTTFSDTVLFSDGRTTDEGLRSIAWFPEPGTDTSKFIVLPVSPPILRCFNDKQIHRIEVRQLDTTASGCYDFVFTDCVGHQVFDTVCFAAHMLEGVTASGGENSMALEAIHPNPFSGTTTVTYSIVTDGLVRLTLYDELGREVAQLLNSRQASGRHTQQFDGAKLPEGSYIVRLESGGKVSSRRVVIER